MESISRRLCLGVLACLLCREATCSTVSAVTVPLAKAVSDSPLIVVGSVEEISEHRLIFFLSGPENAGKLSLPDARFLICGRAYDTLAIKRAVLKRLP